MEHDPLDRWLPINLLVKEEPAFTEPAIRYHVFCAQARQSSTGIIEGNKLAPAIRRVGRKVLIHQRRFRRWIETGSAE
jgi:hypothetical protein